jgi:Cu/Ag efflux pump CusA
MGAPMALLGGLVAVYLGGGTLSLGSLLGFVTILGLTTRNGIMLVRHFQHLERHEGEHDAALVLHGARDRFSPVAGTTITIGLIVLPFVVIGDVAGLEIAHPTAVVVFGGLVTSTLLTLFLVPAVYLRFGVNAVAETLDLEPEIA